MKRIIVLVFLLLSFITSPGVYADVIDPDQKPVELYYQIININNYPDYVFLIHGNPSPSYQILNSTEFSIYKFSRASVYAISKKDFNPAELENMNHSELDYYFTNNRQVIPSHLEINGSYGTVNQLNPLEKVVIELEITSLNQTHLEIKKTQAKYIYRDGTVKKADFQDQNTIPPEPSFIGSDHTWYFVVASAAFIIILLILMKRRRA